MAPETLDHLDSPCACGAPRRYGQCCGPLIAGSETAVSAEALMRSRYSAFAIGALAYLRATWHPETCPSDLEIDPAARWIGLKVLDVEAGGPDDAQGYVEFIARYKIQGRAYRLHERSCFVRYRGQWRYLDGAKR